MSAGYVGDPPPKKKKKKKSENFLTNYHYDKQNYSTLFTDKVFSSEKFYPWVLIMIVSSNTLARPLYGSSMVCVGV